MITSGSAIIFPLLWYTSINAYLYYTTDVKGMGERQGDRVIADFRLTIAEWGRGDRVDRIITRTYS